MKISEDEVVSPYLPAKMAVMMRLGEERSPQPVRFRRVRDMLLLCLFSGALLGMPHLESEPANGSLTLLPGAAAIEFTVGPSATVDFTVQVPSGQAAVLTLIEEDQTSLVTWTDSQEKTHLPRTNRAGRGASIRFTLIGNAGSPQRFSVSSANPKKSSSLRATVTSTRGDTAQDALTVSAEDALAKGEFLWSKHDLKDGSETLAAFDSAIHTWEQLGDDSMLRSSLTWKAIELSFVLGRAQEGLPLLTRATELPDSGDIVEQANTWKTLGFVQTELADYSDGWADYEKALRLFQTTGDLFNQEVLLENRGSLSRMTGDYSGALNDATAADKLARDLNDQVGMLHIEDEIGAIHLQRGDMQAAFDAYQRMLALEQLQPGDPMIGFAETDLALLYHRLGATVESQDMLHRVGAFWSAHPYLLGQLNTLIQQGDIEAEVGHLSQAAAAYGRDVKLAAQANMKRELVFGLLGLGTVEGERGEIIPAAASFDRALRLASEIHESDALARIYIAQGDLAMRKGHLATAHEDYRHALDAATESYDQADSIRALGGMAESEFRTGDYAGAQGHIERALDGIESTRDSIAPGALQTSYFSSGHSYYSLAIRVQMRMEASHPGSGWVHQALETAERGRARFLLDHLQQSAATIEMHADPALAADYSQAVRELHFAESGLTALRTRGQGGTKVQELQAKVAGLKERLDEIEGSLSKATDTRSSVEDATTGHLRSSLVSQLQQRLGSDAALLEYWTDKDVSYLWVVTATSLRSFTLPGLRELEPMATTLSDTLASPFTHAPSSVQRFAATLSGASAGFDAASQRLANVVLPRGALPPDAHSLLVVGDGPMLSIPFEALRIGMRHEAAEFLMDRYAVVREPSVGVLLALLEHDQTPRALRIALFADPVFNREDSRFSATAVGLKTVDAGIPASGGSGIGTVADWTQIAGAEHLARLAYTGREAQSIAALVGAENTDLALGFSAAVDRVRSTSWIEYTIAHFATHALLNAQHPELDTIALSLFNGAGQPQSGLLWYSDILSLHMPVPLVVLSTCQSANGAPMPGEGLVGLSYAFFLAGAHRVVASLWDTDDQATEALMRRFYTALISRSRSPAEALRSAQRELAATPRWKNPYYWAGFSIEGDPRSFPK